MKRILRLGLTAIFILIGIIILSKDYILKTTLQSRVKNYLGIKLEMDEARLSLINTAIELKGFKLYNPEEFPQKTLAIFPKIFIDFYPKELLFGKIHLKNANIDLESLSIIRNASGQLNVAGLNKITPGQKDESRTKKKNDHPFLIDKLVLSIGKITYEEYSDKERSKYQEFVVDIKDRTFENVTSFNQITSVLAAEIIKGKMTDILDTELDSVKEKLETPQEVIKKSLENLKEKINFYRKKGE